MSIQPHKQNGRKPFTRMTTDELCLATREYDQPVTGDELPGKPLTAAQRRLWQKAKARRPGRPRVGNGVKVISLSVEKSLLALADAEAKSRGVSRAEVFACGLRATLCAQGRNEKP